MTNYSGPIRTIPRPPDRDIETRVAQLERFEHYQAEKNGELLSEIKRVGQDVASIRTNLEVQAAIESLAVKGSDRWRNLLFTVMGAIVIGIVFLLARQAAIVQGARL